MTMTNLPADFYVAFRCVQDSELQDESVTGGRQSGLQPKA
jgi:hypothetical protein